MRVLGLIPRDLKFTQEDVQESTILSSSSDDFFGTLKLNTLYPPSSKLSLRKYRQHLLFKTVQLQ